MEAIARQRGVTVAQVSLAWTLSRPAVASLVVGGLTEAQFRENIAAADLQLSQAELDTLNRVSRLPYLYPYWHQHNFARDRFSAGDWALHDSYEDLGLV